MYYLSVIILYILATSKVLIVRLIHISGSVVVFILKTQGVAMADIVKALALIVHIAAAWVRFPAEAGTKMDIGMAAWDDSKTGQQWMTSS